MLDYPHIIDVDVGRIGFRHHDRIIPESKAFSPIRTFRYSKKGFPVVPLHSGDQVNFPIEFNGAGIEHTVDPHPFHEIRV